MKTTAEGQTDRRMQRNLRRGRICQRDHRADPTTPPQWGVLDSERHSELKGLAAALGIVPGSRAMRK